MPSKPVEGVIYGHLFTFLPPTRASQFLEQTAIVDKPKSMLSLLITELSSRWGFLTSLKIWKVSENPKSSICRTVQPSISLESRKSPSTMQAKAKLNKSFKVYVKAKLSKLGWSLMTFSTIQGFSFIILIWCMYVYRFALRYPVLEFFFKSDCRNDVLSKIGFSTFDFQDQTILHRTHFPKIVLF